MTVESTARKQQFALNGTTSTLTFTFRALVSAPTDIKVIATDGDGVDTDLVYTTDYTVAVNANGVGGVVTLVDPADVGSGIATVYRDTTNKQESDYDDYNQFPADTLETDLDIRTLVSQEGAEASDRILQLPISYTGTATTILPTPVADKMLGWNSAANALENKTFVPSSDFEKATLADAQAGINDVKYMTPLLIGSTPSITTISLTVATLVIAPATNTADKVPQWDGANSKKLKDGLTVGTGASNLVQLDGSSKLPTIDGSALTNLLIGQKIGGWINFNGTGTIAIQDSYNVSSITDNNTGDYTINWDTDFSDADYAIGGAVKLDTAGSTHHSFGIASVANNPLAASVRIVCFDRDGTVQDCVVVTIMAIQ